MVGSLCHCIVILCTLRKWHMERHYFSLVVWPGVKQHFTVVGQAQFVCLMCHGNSIWVISWRWYDVWDEKEKTWVYVFADSKDLRPPTQYKHVMRGIGLWWCCKLYTVGKPTGDYVIKHHILQGTSYLTPGVTGPWRTAKGRWLPVSVGVLCVVFGRGVI